MQRSSVWFWVSLTGVILLSRLCHANILWADEDYHLAAAIQMLHGKMLYRDLWYDKPPLTALVGAAVRSFSRLALADRVEPGRRRIVRGGLPLRVRISGAGVKDIGRPGCWHFR